MSEVKENEQEVDMSEVKENERSERIKATIGKLSEMYDVLVNFCMGLRDLCTLIISGKKTANWIKSGCKEPSRYNPTKGTKK